LFKSSRTYLFKKDEGRISTPEKKKHSEKGNKVEVVGVKHTMVKRTILGHNKNILVRSQMCQQNPQCKPQSKKETDPREAAGEKGKKD
jgi:hypothetical protein